MMSGGFKKGMRSVDYGEGGKLMRDLGEGKGWRMEMSYLKLSNGEWVYLG